MNNNKLSEKELAALRNMFADKINAIDAKVKSLQDERHTLVAMLQKVTHSGLGLQDTAKPNGSDAILRVIKQIYGVTDNWMKPGEVRRNYEVLTGKELSKSTLQFYHRKYEDKVFERRGEKRYTEWRMISNKVN